MKTQSWGSTFQFPQHQTLASISQGMTIERQDSPSLSDLKPGDTMQFSRKPVEDQISWTQDDKVEFKNGGSVEDLPGESGLLVTSPDGARTQVSGWIDRDEQGQPVINTRTYVADQDEWMTWSQSFPEQGGMVMERLPERGEADRSVSILESGQVTVLGAQDYGDDLGYTGRLDGKALVLQNDWRGEAVIPAVPFEWVLKD